LQGNVQTGPKGYYYAIIELTYSPNPIVVPPPEDPWKDAGIAPNVEGLAYWDGILYAATSITGAVGVVVHQLSVRDASDVSALWQPVGSLMLRQWTGLTALDGKLYAVTEDDQLLIRDAVPSDAAWAPIPSTNSNVVALAAFDGNLYAATSDNQLSVRDAVSAEAGWTVLGPAPNNLVGLAASWYGSGWVLYAATSDNQLFIRNPSVPDGTWQPLEDADNLTVLAGAVYTAHSGAVFAATSEGRLRMLETARIT
jgi:hypothetical protein